MSMQNTKVDEKRGRVVIAWGEIFWAMLLLGFLESPFLSRYTVFEIVYMGMLLLSAIYMLAQVRSVVVSRAALCILVYEILLLVSTTINGGINSGILLSAAKFILFILVLDSMLMQNFRRCIKVLHAVFEVLVWINCLTIFLFPHGLYNMDVTPGKYYYFLGHQNTAGVYLLFAMMLGILHMRLESEQLATIKINKKPITVMQIRLTAMTVVGAVAVVKVWSALSIVGLTVFLLLLWYDSKSKKGWTFNLKWAILLNVIVFFVFIVFQRMDLLTWILENVLHRDATLTGRTDIWDAALQAFADHPLFGVGLGQGKDLFGFTTAHNRYLNILFTGGLLAMAAFLVLLWMTSTQIQKHVSHKVMRICSVFLWTTLFMLQVETFDANYFFIMFLVPCHLARYLELENSAQETVLAETRSGKDV